MTNDIRVLARERMLRNKPAQSEKRAPNRQEKRNIEKAARRIERRTERPGLLHELNGKEEMVGGKNGGEGLVERLEKPGFVRTRAGLLISAVLAAELFAAGCGSVVADDEEDGSAEVDSEPDADAPDFADEHDGNVDEGIEPEDFTEVEEDGAGPDEASGDEGTETEVDGETDGEADSDAIECTETVADEPRAPITGPEPFCGLTQTNNVIDRVTDLSEGCETPGRTSLMIERNMALSSALSTSGLACARGTDIYSLNGPMIIVGLEPTRLEMARKIAKATLHVTESVGGTAGEYTLTLTSMRADSVVLAVYNTGGEGLGNIYVYLTGYIVLPGMPNRAAIAYNLDRMGSATCGVAIIELPTRILNTSDVDIWTDGDRGEFTFDMDTIGSELFGYGWRRNGIPPLD